MAAAAANADAAELFVVRVVPLLCNSNGVGVGVDGVVVALVEVGCRRRNNSRVRCKPFDTAFVELDAVFDVAGLSVFFQNISKKTNRFYILYKCIRIMAMP